MRLLVFTDLDGTLMEHESYSVEPARAALQALKERSIPLILSSSKTSEEIRAVQKLLDLDTPFICENGAALHLGKDPESGESCIEFGSARTEWLPRVHQLREQNQWKFEGFADWTAKFIAEITGLSEAEAELAKRRQYSEPILWRDSRKAKQNFESMLRQLDLRLLEGGRFLSIQSHFDKGDAMRLLLSRYGKDERLISVALGDSPNDAAMLEQADIAVLIKSAKSEQISLQAPKIIIRTQLPGPAGWQEAMDEILTLLDDGRLESI